MEWAIAASAVLISILSFVIKASRWSSNRTKSAPSKQWSSFEIAKSKAYRFERPLVGEMPFTYSCEDGRENTSELFPQPTSFGKHVSRHEALRRLFFRWSGIERKSIPNRFLTFEIEKNLRKYKIAWREREEQHPGNFISDMQRKLHSFTELIAAEEKRAETISSGEESFLEDESPLFQADRILTLELFYYQHQNCPLDQEDWKIEPKYWEPKLLVYVLCRWPASLPEEMLSRMDGAFPNATAEQLSSLVAQPLSPAVQALLWRQLSKIRRSHAKILLGRLMQEPWKPYCRKHFCPGLWKMKSFAQVC
jgi:hypothetical protein